MSIRHLGRVHNFYYCIRVISFIIGFDATLYLRNWDNRAVAGYSHGSSIVLSVIDDHASDMTAIT